LEKDILYKLPPGYKDAGKDDEGIGDLLIWQTILEVAKTHGKSVIFVSADQKPDWWSKSEGSALYPRYELIDEFRRISLGQSFHIIRFSGFLDLYGASKEVVKEVQREERQSIVDHTKPADRLIIRRAVDAEGAIFKWLQQQHPDRVRLGDADE